MLFFNVVGACIVVPEISPLHFHQVFRSTVVANYAPLDHCCFRPRGLKFCVSSSHTCFYPPLPHFFIGSDYVSSSPWKASDFASVGIPFRLYVSSIWSRFCIDVCAVSCVYTVQILTSLTVIFFTVLHCDHMNYSATVDWRRVSSEYCSTSPVSFSLFLSHCVQLCVVRARSRCLCGNSSDQILRPYLSCLFSIVSR
jgi:hypothetical protein